ncbi:hypothetical protein BST33_17645 [Mycolicibacter minnesotensis]|uniref:Low molecular weight antigen MTB12-like C-terminal domain-containing protein n=1 Tax=Mycolicibacter minnesotensis TaxID=1118379 RepID=A0AA91M2K7_9MYCO|nr:hypothetical protein BST33_17645 [Mycolicibacter minnesotensis]
MGIASGLGGVHAHAEPPVTPVPSASQLTSQVAVIFDTDADRALRASYLEAGAAALPVADVLAGPMAQHRSMVSMRVEDPVSNGDRLSSQLVMAVMGIGAQRREINWVEHAGSWKLTTDSLCSLYTEVSRGQGCPL